MRVLLIAPVLLIAACGGGSSAEELASVDELRDLIADAGFECADYEYEEPPDTNAKESAMCNIDGVRVEMSIYRDNSAIDAVYDQLTLIGCSDYDKRFVVGNKWAIWPQSNDLSDDLADAIDGARTRDC